MTSNEPACWVQKTPAGNSRNCPLRLRTLLPSFSAENRAEPDQPHLTRQEIGTYNTGLHKDLNAETLSSEVSAIGLSELRSVAQKPATVGLLLSCDETGEELRVPGVSLFKKSSFVYQLNLSFGV